MSVSASNLPDDILRELFISTIHVSHNKYPTLNFAKKLLVRSHPQLALARVCSRWRNLAIRFPQLWKQISIHFPTGENLEIAKAWLSRAGDVPVSITLSITSYKLVQDLRSLFTDFLSQYRLEHLYILYDAENSPPLDELLSSLPSQAVACLASLTMSHAGEHYEPWRWEMDDIRYPRLSSLTLLGKWNINGPSKVLSFLHCAAELEIPQCWKLLRNFPALEECIIVPKEQFDHEPAPQLSTEELAVHLPLLKRFHLTLRVLHTRPVETTFIQPLVLPNLEFFHMSGCRVDWSMTAFRHVAKQSGYFPNLRSFTLAGTTNEFDVGVLLQLIPSLTTLSLGPNAIFTEATLIGLASVQLGPRLQNIKLAKVVNPVDFVEMLESRTESVAPFSRVTFYVSLEEYGKISSRLLPVRERGLDAVVYRRDIKTRTTSDSEN